MLFHRVSALALACALSNPAVAAEDESADQIIVTGTRPQYGVETTSIATRTGTKIRDIPQSISVITESQIEDQSLRSIADVLTYVPGAMPGTGEGNRDQITLRGNNTTADFFVDGIRDDVQYFRDLYNAERIEVLRGPNAMIFGRGGGGGIVNRVTKRSTFAPYREFSIAGDSEGGVRLTGDIDQPLSASAGLRVNGVYENGESFRRDVELERYAVNPTLGLALGAATRIDLSYEFLHDRRTADRGVPSTGGRPLKGVDSLFFGNPEDSFSDADVHLVSLAVEHRFSDALLVRNRTLYGDYDKYYQNIFPTSAVSTTGTVSLSAYSDTTRRKNLFSQTDLVWNSRLGGLDQTILLGFEIGEQNSRQRRRNGFFASTGTGSRSVLVTAPTVDDDLVFLPFNTSGGCRPGNTAPCTPANFVEGEASVLALYAQDQIRLGILEIVAGLRFDRFKLDVTNLNTGRTFSRTDELFSPRIGLILKPLPQLSLYASYSRSYLPSSGDQFSGLDLTSEALKPEKFDNHEVGAKWEPIEGLLATIALYQLERTNTRAVDPTDPQRVVLTGTQRSRGLEIGLERNITDRWQISAGYTLQKAEITRTTAAAPEGREVPFVPRHQASLWSRYDFTGRLGLGLGVVARSKAYAGLSNAVTLPGYARVDAAVFYEIADGLEAQLNVENLLGEDYFATAHNDNNIAPGAPTTARATLRFSF